MDCLFHGVAKSWTLLNDFHTHIHTHTHTNAGDVGLIPGSGRSPGKGNSNPLQYSCLENPMDRGAWQVHGVAKELDTTEWLNNTMTSNLFLFIYFRVIEKYSNIFFFKKKVSLLILILLIWQKVFQQFWTIFAIFSNDLSKW